MKETFFRICVFYCIAMIVFSLSLLLIQSTGALDIATSGGVQISDTGDVLSYATPLEEQNMDYIWGLIIGASFAGGAIGVLMHSVVPVGIFIFGGVFWGSYLSAWSSINVGGYLPTELIVIFSIVSVFLFIGAIIGMATGSG